jgi:hypothetical protein
MMRIFEKGGLPVAKILQEGVYRIKIHFTKVQLK